MDWKLGGLIFVLAMDVQAASDWPEGAEQALADSCMMEAIAGTETTDEEIRIAKAACKCFASQMANSISYAEAQRLATSGMDAAAEYDLSPEGQRVKAKIGVACERQLKALDGPKDKP